MREKKIGNRPTVDAIKWCLILIAVYIFLLIVLPIHNQTVFTYHLSPFEYKVSQLVISIPVLLVWLVAFWSYAQVKVYSRTLTSASEAKSYLSLSRGLAWLSWTLPISAIAGRFLSISSSSSSGRTALIIITNYIDLILPLVAFIIIRKSVALIIESNGSSTDHSSNNISDIVALLFIFFGILYCYLVLRSFNLSSLGSSHNPYKLPGWLMILSVVIPYLYAWFIGIISALRLNSYSSKITGIIYQRGLKTLSFGLSVIVIGFVVSQYISTAYPTYGHLIFNFNLVANVFVRLVIGAGFVILAYGINRLKKIEEA